MLDLRITPTRSLVALSLLAVDLPARLPGAADAQQGRKFMGRDFQAGDGRAHPACLIPTATSTRRGQIAAEQLEKQFKVRQRWWYGQQQNVLRRLRQSQQTQLV
jgi:hypothetical protein